MLIPHHYQRHLAAGTMVAENMAQVAAVGELFIIGLYDYVTGFEAGFFRGAVFFHRTHQHAFTIFHAKIFAQLARQALCLDAEHGRVSLDLKWQIHAVAGKVTWPRCWHNDARKSLRHDSTMIGQLHIYLNGSAITADAERHGASRRDFTNHAAKLLFTLNRRTVEIENYIVLAKTCFAGGSIRVHHGDRSEERRVGKECRSRWS